MKSLYHTIAKIIYLVVLSVFISFKATAQENIDSNNKIVYNSTSGLNFSFDKGNYQLNLGGFIKPGFLYEKTEGINAENKFGVKNSFLHFSGNAAKEKASFLVQLDYSLSQPLLDAWVAYHPHKSTKIIFGQKQTFVNNREMMYREDRLQFTNRSMLSKSLSSTGREFGFFVESKFGNSFIIAPKLAITSGDGRNSFGSNSADSDIGGLKTGGRLDVYPLGAFKEGNDLTSIDLEREEKVRFVLGVAGSVNNGVNSANGEGHAEFIIYDASGDKSLANYTQIYADFLLKYKGFSLLTEYANASACNLNRVYLDDKATQILAPTEISEFLFLGDSFNIQTGYVTKSGFGLDFRYNSLKPEFDNVNSLLKDLDGFTVGFTKYFNKNNLKLQTAYSNIDVEKGNGASQIEVLFQISF